MKRNILVIVLALVGFIQIQSSGYGHVFIQKNNEADSLGVLISKIDFNLKATKEDLKIFDDGIIPWISINKPGKNIDSLIGADEIVLPFSEVTLIIDYPLTNKASFDISTAGKGFSRKQLIRIISKKYHEIYKKEEKTAKAKTVPVDKRDSLLNRKQTDGKYGIWGHDLSDLDLGSIDVYKNDDGKIYLILDIES
jgi:hypothetical protein